MKKTRTYDAHETGRMAELHGASLASFSRRAVAFVIDLLFGAILFILPIILLIVSRGTPMRVRTGSEPAEGTLSLNFYDNWISVLWWVLYFGLTTWVGRGRTPGKWLVGIRVVSLVRERLSLWHSVERALGYAASALEFGFGFAQYFVHPNKRTVHDRIAETIVVTERESPWPWKRGAVAKEPAEE